MSGVFVVRLGRVPEIKDNESGQTEADGDGNRPDGQTVFPALAKFPRPLSHSGGG